MTKLSVNVNKIALLRNQRDIGIPSVVDCAQICIDAGAHGITVHPRPDERHIRSIDVDALKQMLTVEYNIEGNPFHNLPDIVRRVRPHQCTMVPDAVGQSTSDHGFDLDRDGSRVEPLIKELKDLDIRVSLFMDAVPANMKKAADLGADRVELYTEPYASAFAEGKADSLLPGFAESARAAQEAKLGVNAGHDLNLKNLGLFCERVPNVLEVSIGHALIAEALEMGLSHTVKAYLKVLGHA